MRVLRQTLAKAKCAVRISLTGLAASTARDWGYVLRSALADATSSAAAFSASARFFVSSRAVFCWEQAHVWRRESLPIWRRWRREGCTCSSGFRRCSTTVASAWRSANLRHSVGSRRRAWLESIRWFAGCRGARAPSLGFATRGAPLWNDESSAGQGPQAVRADRTDPEQGTSQAVRADRERETFRAEREREARRDTRGAGASGGRKARSGRCQVRCESCGDECLATKRWVSKDSVGRRREAPAHCSRCSAKGRGEPWSRGGADSSENLRLLCHAHNRLLAERDFGAAHIARSSTDDLG